MQSREGNAAGLGALSALLTLSRSITLVVDAASEKPATAAGAGAVAAEEIEEPTADLIIAACAIVGGLKLESRIMRFVGAVAD